VADFAKHFGKSPDKLGPNELRTYQAYLLKERKLTPGSAVNCVAALRFFFVKTLKRYQFREFLPYPKDRRRLPTVLSPEEVSRWVAALIQSRWAAVVSLEMLTGCFGPSSTSN
jgi:integrase/recombinase XerD